MRKPLERRAIDVCSWPVGVIRFRCAFSEAMLVWIESIGHSCEVVGGLFRAAVRVHRRVRRVLDER
jgi:hypothetical protein